MLGLLLLLVTLLVATSAKRFSSEATQDGLEAVQIHTVLAGLGLTVCAGAGSYLLNHLHRQHTLPKCLSWLLHALITGLAIFPPIRQLIYIRGEPPLEFVPSTVRVFDKYYLLINISIGVVVGMCLLSILAYLSTRENSWNRN